MSDYLAVAGVSAVLKWVLYDALMSGPTTILGGGLSGISALSPDLIATGADEQPQVNLFMYYASRNSSYRNVGLPSLDDQGNRLSNPPLALNLHYLVSAYGKNEFDAEILLGWAMQVLHENPILPRQTIQDKLAEMVTGASVPELQLIATTTLASQTEHIKITPESLSNEEISKLWMAFSTHYRPTTSYQISVVLIQETQPFQSNLRVRHRKILVLPWQSPSIESLSPQIIGAGETLTITGQNFISGTPSDTLVSFDGSPPILPASVQGSCIRIIIPTTLQAGVRTVRIVNRIRFGVPTDPHPGFSSSPTPFLLVPAITTPPPIVANVGSTLSLAVTPPVGRNQQAVLLIGDSAIEINARAPSDPPTSTNLSFPIPSDFPHSHPPVSLPLRVQIDGAQSGLTLDTNPSSPTYGQFLPQVEVTGP